MLFYVAEEYYKFKIIDLCLPTSRAIGVKILTQAGIPILVWSAHLNHRLYGPHAAQNKLVTSADQIINGEYQSGRVKNVQEILENEETKQWISMGNSVIIAGDFNCPSHLDWIEENKHIHGGWAVEWPVTKTLEQAGFSDSFRIIYPNVVDEPGFSWSPIHKFNKDWDYAIIPEPQDRLDFIFYKGGIQPINSSLYAGSEPLRIIQRDGQHKMNDYPSDHYALITDFVLPK
uniref:Endo/exonuclease/phosphatase domain-containing protein n=1 Tax=Heterorhabditis bacteriophora TaxID=37862 RepID=A0A1I7X8K0_HETBA